MSSPLASATAAATPLWRARARELFGLGFAPSELAAIAVDNGVVVRAELEEVRTIRAMLDALRPGFAASILDVEQRPSLPIGIVVRIEPGAHLLDSKTILEFQVAPLVFEDRPS